MRILLALIVTFSAAATALAQKEYGFDNRKPSGQPYLKPEESVARFKVPDEFEVKLFAAEPLIVNPVAFTIDEKGRVWVVECFEYPKRAGKNAPRDRIVILEDTKGTGVCDKRTVFAEGKDFPVPESGRKPDSGRSICAPASKSATAASLSAQRLISGSSKTRTTSRASSKCC